MRSNFNKTMLAVVRKEAERCYPNEACGVVVAVGKKQLVLSAKNASANPGAEFLISHEEYARFMEIGEVIAIWHTHVNIPPTPSDADRVGCEATSMPWFIMSIYKNEVGETSFSDIELLEPSGFEMDYLERPYVFGVMDCWTLVRDYYRREYNVTLGEYPRIEGFWRNGHDFFGDMANWEREGFRRLIDEQPVPGDCFLIATDDSRKPNHIAIYIGNGLMLHHCHGRLSCRDVYCGFWEKHTMHHIRHKDVG